MTNRRILTGLEITSLATGDARDAIKIIERLTPNQEIAIYSNRKAEGTRPLEEYLERLKEADLDVAKGTSKCGFRMPLPPRGVEQRDLIIFRRH